MRSFSLVLLRRFLLRPLLSESQARSTLSWRAPRPTLSDNLSPDTLAIIQRLLLHSFSHEPSVNVRHASVEAITALANDSMQKDRPWNELQEQAFNMTQNPNAALRESAFRLLAGTRMFGLGVRQTDIVLKVLKGGLEDRESIDVSFFTVSSIC
jgi:importin-5